MAVPNATQSAPIIVHTGESVMTLGGYLGTDPTTPADLERRVKAGDVRFVVLGGPSLVALENTAPNARWLSGPRAGCAGAAGLVAFTRGGAAFPTTRRSVAAPPQRSSTTCGPRPGRAASARGPQPGSPFGARRPLSFLILMIFGIIPASDGHIQLSIM